MTVSVYSYTIYLSPNAYLGTVLLRRALSDFPGVELVRRPICVPRDRELMIAGLLGGKENKNAGSYNREDCRLVRTVRDTDVLSQPRRLP